VSDEESDEDSLNLEDVDDYGYEDENPKRSRKQRVVEEEKEEDEEDDMSEEDFLSNISEVSKMKQGKGADVDVHKLTRRQRMSYL